VYFVEANLNQYYIVILIAPKMSKLLRKFVNLFFLAPNKMSRKKNVLLNLSFEIKSINGRQKFRKVL